MRMREGGENHIRPPSGLSLRVEDKCFSPPSRTHPPLSFSPQPSSGRNEHILLSARVTLPVREVGGFLPFLGDG